VFTSPGHHYPAAGSRRSRHDGLAHGSPPTRARPRRWCCQAGNASLRPQDGRLARPGHRRQADPGEPSTLRPSTRHPS